MYTAIMIIFKIKQAIFRLVESYLNFSRVYVRIVKRISKQNITRELSHLKSLVYLNIGL